MPTNCPLGKKETHDCWECLFNGHRESNIAFNVQGKNVHIQTMRNLIPTIYLPHQNLRLPA